MCIAVTFIFFTQLSMRQFLIIVILFDIKASEFGMLNSEKILELINENQDEIKKYGVKKIGLFGSYLKNQQKKDSDIDILIEFKKGKKTFDNYMDLKFFLEELFHRNVDLVIKEALRVELKPNILRSVRYAT